MSITADNRKKRSGLKTVLIIIGTVFAAAVLVAAGWFLTEDYRSYTKGVELLDGGDLVQAAEIFEELGNYKDSRIHYCEARYGTAQKLIKRKDYLEAADILKEIEEYLDSGELVSECFYKQGIQERGKDNFDEAYRCFTDAGDYEDSPYQAQKTIYEKGHSAFLEENFEEAFRCFESLEGNEEDYGAPHFIKLKDADAYLEQKRDEGAKDIRLYVSEEPYGDELDLDITSDDILNIYTDVVNYIPFQAGTAVYDKTEKLIQIMIIGYYPGDRIIDAWEKGDLSSLSEDEKKTLELGLELVERAKAETESELELEIWLHDWLCEKITYESPDMNVLTLELVTMRQLSCVGAMLDGKANCQGYADAFYLLGTLAGFEIDRVLGMTEEGHIWNTIRLDGADYIVDVTFDDMDDEKYSGWTYNFFNAPWDRDVYEVYGGEETVPLLTEEFSLEKSVFSIDGGCFKDEKSAARHIVKCLKKNSRKWAHVMVEGKEISIESFDKAVESVRGTFGNGKTWLFLMEHYNGNTYVSVRFE